MMSKTALELSRHEWQQYTPTAVVTRRKWEADETVKSRWQAAQELAQQAAQLLRTDFAAKKVILFGSATHPSLFTPWSDVDLAVEGISATQFYAAVATVTGLSSSFRVDLIDLGTCTARLRQEIEQHGVDL
jgi:predicted nucleotidyltransferase